MAGDTVLTFAEAAKRFGITYAGIRQAILAAKVPVVLVPGRAGFGRRHVLGVRLAHLVTMREHGFLTPRRGRRPGRNRRDRVFHKEPQA